MESFPPLFKDNLEWRIEVQPQEGGENSGVILRTEHGVRGGKKTVHERCVTEGKQGRSVMEQALREAGSRHRLKMEKDLYSPSVVVVGSPITKTRGTLRPMLAQTFSADTTTTMVFPCVVQPKYDGIRARCVLDGEDMGGRGGRGGGEEKEEEPRFFSRAGVPIGAGEAGMRVLGDAVRAWMRAHPGVVLDGELYSPELPFEELSGLFRRKAIPVLPASVGYYVFDVLTHGGMPYRARRALLEGPEGLYASSRFPLCAVPTWEAENVHDAVTIHDRLVTTEHMEGIMLRDPESVYRMGKRSSGLQKFKTFQDDEFEIVGFREAEGEDRGTVLWECRTTTGKCFSVRPRGTREARAAMLQSAPSMIGKPLTVLFQEMSRDGVPRFPVGKTVRVF
jgi:hypothetical protein